MSISGAMRWLAVGRRTSLAPAAFPLVVLPPEAQRPNGPTTIVVPYTPGTVPDILARPAALLLLARSGQPVVAEDRARVSGDSGVRSVAWAVPDRSRESRSAFALGADHRGWSGWGRLGAAPRDKADASYPRPEFKQCRPGVLAGWIMKEVAR